MFRRNVDFQSEFDWEALGSWLITMPTNILNYQYSIANGYYLMDSLLLIDNQRLLIRRGLKTRSIDNRRVPPEPTSRVGRDRHTDRSCWFMKCWLAVFRFADNLAFPDLQTRILNQIFWFKILLPFKKTLGTLRCEFQISIWKNFIFRPIWFTVAILLAVRTLEGDPISTPSNTPNSRSQTS